MSFRELVCKSPADFSSSVKEASEMVGGGGKIILLFTGAIKPETGKMVGDCTRAEPVINKVMEETNDSVLVECIVECRYRSSLINIERILRYNLHVFLH